MCQFNTISEKNIHESTSALFLDYVKKYHLSKCTKSEIMNPICNFDYPDYSGETHMPGKFGGYKNIQREYVKAIITAHTWESLAHRLPESVKSLMK